MTGAVRFEIASSVATVTLSNSGKFNAMSRAMWGELRAVFEAIQHSQNVRCVLIRGEDEHFCAGGDIAEYPQFRFHKISQRDFHENDVWSGLRAMVDCDVPIVAHIEGNCMGAGIEIASCCDIRIAADTARFGAPIAKLGFPMAPREAALVINAVGELTAREMLLSAAVLSATEMQQRGFLNQVLEAHAASAAAQERVLRICQLASQAARLNKASFRALALIPRAQQAINLIATSYDYAASDEHREGITAFIEKRPPVFAT